MPPPLTRFSIHYKSRYRSGSRKNHTFHVGKPFYAPSFLGISVYVPECKSILLLWSEEHFIRP